MTNLYDLEFNLPNGNSQPMQDYAGKVVLIVNTASKCGFTPQFDGLEQLHKKYASRGLVILGFPCNQFGRQDPGTMQEITEFCQLNYGVTFTMAEKIEVNGNNCHPLFKHLKSSAQGLLGSEKIKWNFTKFLINREGDVVKRFAPITKPEALSESIEALL